MNAWLQTENNRQIQTGHRKDDSAGYRPHGVSEPLGTGDTAFWLI